MTKLHTTFAPNSPKNILLEIITKFDSNCVFDRIPIDGCTQFIQQWWADQRHGSRHATELEPCFSPIGSGPEHADPAAIDGPESSPSAATQYGI